MANVCALPEVQRIPLAASIDLDSLSLYFLPHVRCFSAEMLCKVREVKVLHDLEALTLAWTFATVPQISRFYFVHHLSQATFSEAQIRAKCLAELQTVVVAAGEKRIAALPYLNIHAVLSFMRMTPEQLAAHHF